MSNPYKLIELKSYSNDDGIQQQLQYISLIDDAKLILNDQKALDIIKSVYLNIEIYTRIAKLEKSAKSNYVDNFIKLISLLKDDLISSLNYNLINQYTNLLFQVIIVCKNFTQISKNFCYEFTKRNGVHALFKYLSDDLLLNEYIKISCEPAQKEYVFVNGIIRSIIQTILNLQNVYDQETNQFWTECLPSLIKFLKAKFISDNKVALYLAISNICDSDIGSLIDEIIHETALLIGYSAEEILKNEFVERISVNSMQEACIITSTGREWNILNLLKSLFNLSKINDRLKQKIYFENDLKSSLKLIVKNGNLIEKDYSLLLLSELILNGKILSHIKLDEEFCKSITELKGIAGNSEKILTFFDKASNNEMEKNEKKQIMISFNRECRESKEACLLIKSELKNDYNVWIEFENIGDSFKKAIQNSFCVIICVTESYKKDVRCKTQAEYARHLKKPIIMLVMEKELAKDEW